MTEPKQGYSQKRERCNAGHTFTPENTYWRPDGRMECKTCTTRRQRAPGRKRRRSVSITAEAYVLLQKVVAHAECSGSGWVESLVRGRAIELGITALPDEVDQAMGLGPEREESWEAKRALADAAFGGARFSG